MARSGLQRHVLGLAYEVRGREFLPPNHLTSGAAVIVAKHQSAWETLIFHALLPDTVFILKKSLLWLPLIGWYLLKTGQVAIDRRGGARALGAMVRAAREALARRQPGDRVFPEGHRQPPGVTGTYLPGAAISPAKAPAGDPGGAEFGPVLATQCLTCAARAPSAPGSAALAAGPRAPRRDRRTARRIETATRALEAEALARHPDLASGFPGRARHDPLARDPPDSFV